MKEQVRTFCPSTSNFRIVVLMILVGVGIGITMPVLNIAVQNVFPQHQIGVVSAGLQFFRNLGATIGTAILGTIMSSGMKNGLLNAIHNVFITGFFIGLGGLFIILFLKEIELKNNIEVRE